MELHDRYAGALLGLACGDPVGSGASMALCLADSLLACNGFNARDQMQRYVRWWRQGERSVTGRCFDIGGATRTALERFERTGDPYSGSTGPRTAGNGSLMRLAPVVLHAHPDGVRAVELAAESSRTTHAAPEAIDACRLLAWVLHRILDGAGIARLLDGAVEVVRTAKVVKIARGSWRHKPDSEIKGGGYAVASLEAALWAFEQGDDFESSVLAAVNLGDHADTTGAITGQLAGAYYGASGIPPHWRARLAWGDEIAALGAALMGATHPGAVGA